MDQSARFSTTISSPNSILLEKIMLMSSLGKDSERLRNSSLQKDHPCKAEHDLFLPLLIFLCPLSLTGNRLVRSGRQ